MRKPRPKKLTKLSVQGQASLLVAELGLVHTGLTAEPTAARPGPLTLSTDFFSLASLSPLTRNAARTGIQVPHCTTLTALSKPCGFLQITPAPSSLPALILPRTLKSLLSAPAGQATPSAQSLSPASASFMLSSLKGLTLGLSSKQIQSPSLHTFCFLSFRKNNI